ncbi:MAG TPA: hypothetical protein VFA56_02880 [Gaiellaceae bacterium]|nr:hypothetical protein [Gaiellaceae bacterium]
MRQLAKTALVCAFAFLCLAGVASASEGSDAAIHPGAHTGFTRTWNWVVTKSDDVHSSVTVAQNGAATINYTVTVQNGNPPTTDSDWFVQDGIPIQSASSFTLTSVAASATQGVVTTPGTIGACATDGSFATIVSLPFTANNLVCSYKVMLPSGDPGTVTASALFGDSSPQSGTTSFNFLSGGNLVLGMPTIAAATVDVVDSLGGTLGSLTAPVDHPATFTYSYTVPTGTCGEFDIPNTVNLIDHATGHSVGHASDTVHVTVTCPHVGGCTLTQGYWKTHSIYGPAKKADPTWSSVGGPDATFFKSGTSWLSVFNTAPAGNAYYQLADQYMAAVLNTKAGASTTPAVDSAIAWATTFFNTYTPAQVNALAKNSPIRAQAIAAASTLDSYNSGLIGPGHCAD